MIPAIRSGFLPNSISTDIHASDINGAMKDLLNVLSQFLALGMDMASVIRREDGKIVYDLNGIAKPPDKAFSAMGWSAH